MFADRLMRNALDTRLLKAERNLDNIIELPGGYLYWDLQELTSAVAGATNVAITAPDTKDLVINGDFANWTADDPDGWAVTEVGDATSKVTENPAGECQIISDGTTTSISQNVLTIGKTYTITMDVSAISGAGNLRWGADGAAQESINSTGAKSFSFTSDSITFVIKRNGAVNATIDNVTVKQTDIAALDEFPGAEKVTNGGFDTDDDWTKTVNLTIADGVANFTGSSGDGLEQDIGAEAGKIYSLSYEIITSDGNDLFLSSAGFTAGTVVLDSTVGVHTITVLATSTNNLDIVASITPFTGTLDNVSLTEANPLNGDHTGVTLGQSGNPQVPVMVEYGGAGDLTDVSRAEFNSMLDPTEFALSIIVQKSTWDAAERYFFSHTVDSDNWIRCGGTGVTGELVWEVNAGGELEQITLASGSPTDLFHMGIQVKSGVMSAIYRGAIIDTEAVAGTFVGNFDTMIIGAKNDTPNNVMLGKLAYHVHNTLKSNAQWLREARAAGGT